MDSNSAIKLVILFILLILSAFFSSAETALTTINRIRLRSLVEEGNKKAIVTQKILDQYSKMLSAILIGNNVVNISASALATALAIQLWGNYAVGIATGILTIFILLFGEIVPKTWAAIYSEKIALLYSSVIYLLIQILTPLIFVVDKLSELIFRLLRIDTAARTDMITESELKTIVDASHQDGIIESEEREIIYNVFDFSDALAKDIMIPRIDMITVKVDASYPELAEIFKDSMYTRIPVYEENNDNVIGIVNIKDLLFIDDRENFQIRSIMRDVYYTYEFKNTADLLIEMRESSSTMALVLNEYGATVGLITLEDLLEEIVGEIRDEYDADEDDFIKEIALREYLVDGGMKLDDINDALGTHFDSEDYDSIGGIIIELLDKLPDLNEEVLTEDGILLRVTELNQNRIEKVTMILPEDDAIDSDEKESVKKDTASE